MDLDSLRNRFAGSHVEFEKRGKDLAVVRLRNAYGAVSVALNGAHVLDYCGPDGEPILWLSEKANLENSKPIRGGVPICWPWFGPHGNDSKKPAHGLARFSQWDLIRVSEGADDGMLSAEFSLKDSEQTRELWPFSFELSYQVRLLSGALDLELTTRNSGDQTFQLSEALHTYFGLRSIHSAAVEGLSGVDYLDQLSAMERKSQSGKVLFDREVDRIYLDVPAKIWVEGSATGKRIEIESRGSQSAVVWNPWIEKSKRMPDFGDEEYLEMLCVETANAGPHALVVHPGESHVLGTTIRAAS